VPPGGIYLLDAMAETVGLGTTLIVTTEVSSEISESVTFLLKYVVVDILGV
jgi:hypothetical protein